MTLTKILVFLPFEGFDPSEVGVPWEFLKSEGHHFTFATPDGKPATADPRMVDGRDLGIFKRLLMADANGLAAHSQLIQSQEFQSPLPYEGVVEKEFDALILPGGHAKGMKVYLQSKLVQTVISDFFASNKPVGAICHGVLAAARSKKRNSDDSVLYGRRTTGLLRSQELTAWNMTRAWLGNYYRTYPLPMEMEVRACLRDSTDFVRGPLPFRRDSFERLGAGFSLQDGNYLSARWPGDAHAFACAFADLLQSRSNSLPRRA